METPGPGTYPSRQEKGVSFSMGIKTGIDVNKSLNKLPGPGSYTLKLDYV